MNKRDILINMEEGIFSYRVAGILIRNGMVLLQHPLNDPFHAFPGGHIRFGETSQEALIREFKEEVMADILPVRLVWVIESYFPLAIWAERRWHQICLYYLVSLCDERQMPLEGRFEMPDKTEMSISHLEFVWTPLSALHTLQVYPTNAQDKLEHLVDYPEHWIYQE